MRLHHVQISAPRGGEDEARAFYGAALGMTEVAKPAELSGRGGCWFRGYDEDGAVTAEIHVGIEEPFLAARRAHPALLLGDVAELDALADRLTAAGHVPDDRERETFPGYLRLHVSDPFGNRVELLARR